MYSVNYYVSEQVYISSQSLSIPPPNLSIPQQKQLMCESSEAVTCGLPIVAWPVIKLYSVSIESDIFRES